jgi:hypothetical protein
MSRALIPSVMDKFCKNCKHYEEGYYYDWCRSPRLGMNLVTGDSLKIKCIDCRYATRMCGKDGKFFEKKESLLKQIIAIIKS